MQYLLSANARDRGLPPINENTTSALSWLAISAGWRLDEIGRAVVLKWAH